MRRIIYLLFVFMLLFVLSGCKKQYSITFDSDGGSVCKPITLKGGVNISKPDDPVKEGYTFLGWYLGDTAYVFDKMPAENITLKAKWEKATFTVTFKDDDETVLKTETVEFGKGATAPQIPEKPMTDEFTFLFDHWDTAFDNVRSDITVHAVYESFKQSYVVVFKTEDGQFINQVTVEYGAAAEAPEVPAKEGYRFTGWDKDFSIVTGSLEVKALYEKNQYTITFDSDGGSAVAPIVKDFGDAVEAPAEPVKAGMNFLGWYLNGAKFIFTTIPAQNITLKAKWEEKGTEGLLYRLNDDDTYTVIGYEGSAENVVIPGTHEGLPVTVIFTKAFEANTVITSLFIPETIREICRQIDTGCLYLRTVVIDEDNPYYKTVNNNIYSKDGTIFYNYAFGQIEDTFTIPSTVNIIDDYAFSGLYYASHIIIPASVQEIGENAFAFSSVLSEISLPNSIYKMEDYAFAYCYKLTSATLDPLMQLTSINEGVFAGSKINAITLPESVTSIGAYAFWGCPFTSFVVPDGVTSIGLEAFCNCTSLSNIVIPDSVTYIGNDAFTYDPWLTAQPSGIIYINNVLYKYHGSMSPGSSITVRDGTVSISPKAFYGIAELASITIPDTVTFIGEKAFQYCSNLTDAVLPNQLHKIPDYLFSNCTILSNVTIGSHVETIGIYAFEYCRNLVSLDLPDTMLEIGFKAFSQCLILSDISLPSGVQKIDRWAFENCLSMINLVIPLSVTDIQAGAFDGCFNLTLYVETTSRPDGWEDGWNSTSPVSWGYHG